MATQRDVESATPNGTIKERCDKKTKHSGHGWLKHNAFLRWCPGIRSARRVPRNA